MRYASSGLCLVLSAVGLLASCGGDTGRMAFKDVGSAPHGRLRVEGGKLLDGNGEQVVLKGLGLGSISAAKALGKWNEVYFANARAWHAEIVRLPVFPADYRAHPDVTLLDLDDAVRWCEAHALYLIIDYHIVGNVTQGLFQWGEDLATTWPEVEAFWAKVSARYANRPTVAFAEIYNEPAALEDQGGRWSFSDWSKHANTIVALVRDHAPKTIPLVAGLDWAYDLSAGGDRPFADPDIALAAHPYPGQAKTNRRAAWDKAFGYLSDRYPFVLTEFGFDPDDQIDPWGTYRADLSYGREILEYAQEKHMSWTPFVFFNDVGWPMPLFSDWYNLTPTYSGQFFKDVLAGQDIATAGMTAVDGGAADAPDAGAITIDDICPPAPSSIDAGPVSIEALVQAFKRGISFGNRLDAPTEGAWGPVLHASDFPLVAQRGFDHVRLPVRFSGHADATAPYALDAEFLARVDWAVAQALKSGLAVLIDMHNYDELMHDPAGQSARFLALWDQVASHYQNCPASVAFELLNEPHDALDSQWNALLAQALAVVRRSNPNRLVVVDGPNLAAAASLADLELPDDPYVMAAVHAYEPLLFCFQGKSWMGPEWGTTGVVYPGPPAAPVTPVADAQSSPWASAWFTQYNTLPSDQNPCDPGAIASQVDAMDSYRTSSGHPVYNAEWGPQDGADLDSRARYMTDMHQACEGRGIGWAVWEDQSGLQLFNASTGAWIEPLTGALFR
jgi:endoglucanase